MKKKIVIKKSNVKGPLIKKAQSGRVFQGPLEEKITKILEPQSQADKNRLELGLPNYGGSKSSKPLGSTKDRVGERMRAIQDKFNEDRRAEQLRKVMPGMYKSGGKAKSGGTIKKAKYGGKMAGLSGKGTLAPKSGNTGSKIGKLSKCRGGC